MIKNISAVEKMIMAGIGFTMILLTARMLYTSDLMYGFYIWNTFLAAVPLLISRQLKKIEKINWQAFVLLCCWLLFFPNAPYIITDIFHFEQRPPVPYWFDLVLVISAAWNGLMLGIVSLIYVERFLARYLQKFGVIVSVSACMLLCSYGVYLGRYLRYNSWTVVTHPVRVLKTTSGHIFFPFQHVGTWAFTFSFTLLLCLVYFTLKQFAVMFATEVAVGKK